MLGSLPAAPVSKWLSNKVTSEKLRCNRSGLSKTQSPTKTDDLPSDVWSKISTHLACERYRFDKGDDGRYYASHREQNLRFIFDVDGLTVKPRNSDTGSNELHLKFRQIRRGNTPTDVGSPKIVADRYRLEYQYVDSGVTEWYLIDSTGLEQGFTLDRPLPGEGLLNLTLTSNIAPQLTGNGSGAQWAINDVTYSYRDLNVIDATGRILPAHLELVLTNDALQIVIDDQDAVYPITIDPLITSQTVQLVAADGAAEDGFGSSVAVSGDVIVIGAPTDDVSGNSNQGSVYVFSRNQGGANNWGQVKQLLANDGLATDWFGFSVAIDGDVIVVGKNEYRNSAYIFVRNQGGANNWGQIKKLSTTVGSGWFGSSVAVSDDLIVVGARYEQVNVNNKQGSAYVFSRNLGGADNWGQVKRLVATDGAIDDQFGRAVDVSKDIIVVGAYLHDVGANSNQGSAYVFSRNQGGADNWGQVKNLIASDGVAGDYFGGSLSVSNDVIVVGAANINKGGAYVFTRNQGGADNWGQVKQLIPIGGIEGDYFGSSVAVSNDVVVVGAAWDDVGTNGHQGTAYIFERNQGGQDNWGHVEQLSAFNGSANDQFGGSVAISGNTIVVGAYQRKVGTNINQGSAYIFTRSGNDWVQVAHPVSAGGMKEDYFGWSVAISNDVIAVGAWGDDVGANIDQGSAYIYTRNRGGANNWGQIQQLIAVDGAAQDRFGWSVAVSDDVVVIGAFDDLVGGNRSQGSAYIFARNHGGMDQWGQVKQLAAPDGAVNDHFGSSVAVSGNIIAVGAPYDTVGTNLVQGSAYIFTRNNGGADNWGQTKQLFASDGSIEARFGSSVAISGDVIVVGAELGTNARQGSAYVFMRNQGGQDNWGQVKQLTAADGAVADYFGSSVAISGDTIVIGSPNDDEAFQIGDSGSAYVFTRNQGGANNWGQLKRLVATNQGTADYFGKSVGISGDIIVVGAYQDDVDSNLNQGSAYIFTRNQGGADTWGQVKQLRASDGFADDQFGISVAVSGDVVVVGAALKDVGANDNQGSAYIFTRNQGGADNWGQVKQITAIGGSTSDQFGYSVSISDDVLLVGAPYDDIGANIDQGSAYIFARNQGQADGWEPVQQLIASNGGAYDNFGYSVSLSGDVAVVGAPKDDNGVVADQGSAYVFAKNKNGMNSWGQLKVLSAVDGGGNDQFGFSVSVSGDVIIVGARLRDIGTNTDQGSAYVFSRNIGGADNWGQVKQLTASDGARSDQFGYSVAVNGDVVVVGALADDIGTNSNQGSAYVFTRNQGGADNWGQIKQLIALDGMANDQFGYSVAVNGDVIVVGAALDDVGANTDQGSAYVFTRNQGGADNWGQVVQLKATNGTAGDKFGVSVGVSGDVIVVGATAADISGKVAQGSAYVFARNQGGADTWGQFEQLIASDGATNDLFGNAVAISGNVIVVGARADNVGANGDEGSVYIFELTNSG